MTDNNNRYFTGMLFLSAVGLVASLWLAYIHFRLHTDPGYDSVCAVGSLLNCETVAASRFSVLADLPTALIGAAYFLVLGLMNLSGLLNKQKKVGGIPLLMSIGAAAASIFFTAVSIISSGALCPGCIIVHLINFTALYLSFRNAGSFQNALEAIRSSLRDFVKNKWSLAQGAGLLALLVLAGPLGALPRYWETAAWISGVRVGHGVTVDHLPWIGAETPTVTIHEFFDYDCPACRHSHKKLRRLLSSRSDFVRIVRHDLSRVSCVDKEGNPSEDRCLAARAAYCAGLQNHFWEFNDAFLAAPPMGPMFERREELMGLLKKLHIDETTVSACMDTPETIAYVQAIYDDGIVARNIKSTPTYFIDGKMMKSKELLPLVRGM